jgi:hypothetical protein
MKKNKIAFNFFILLIVIAGIHEYFKIGESLINSTMSKSFIHGSPFAKKAGENDSLPQEVISANKLIEKYSVDIFGLGPEFYSDPYLLQRVTEFVYPSKIGDSQFILYLKNSPKKIGCSKIDEDGAVNLYECK